MQLQCSVRSQRGESCLQLGLVFYIHWRGILEITDGMNIKKIAISYARSYLFKSLVKNFNNLLTVSTRNLEQETKGKKAYERCKQILMNQRSEQERQRPKQKHFRCASSKLLTRIMSNKKMFLAKR